MCEFAASLAPAPRGGIRAIDVQCLLRHPLKLIYMRLIPPDFAPTVIHISMSLAKVRCRTLWGTGRGQNWLVNVNL
jgi:hypothetical protein